MPASRPTPLPEICEIYGGISQKPESERLAEDFAGEVPAIGLRAISDTGLDLSHLDTVFPPSVAQEENLRVRDGDVLLAGRGITHRAAVATGLHQPRPIYISANVFLLRPRVEIILPEILWAWFNSPAGQEAIERHAHSSTRQRVITMGVLQSLQIPVPPLAKQRQLVEFIRAGVAAQEAAAAAAEQTRRAFSLCLQRIFSTRK